MPDTLTHYVVNVTYIMLRLVSRDVARIERDNVQAGLAGFAVVFVRVKIGKGYQIAEINGVQFKANWPMPPSMRMLSRSVADHYDGNGRSTRRIVRGSRDPPSCRRLSS